VNSVIDPPRLAGEPCPPILTVGSAGDLGTGVRHDERVEPEDRIDGLGYEQARDQLIEVVRALEAGGLSLDDALALWERGERLARRCEQQLAGARERVDAVLNRADAAE
jgi:exodeoxyribonuclease VII small subunit